MFVRLVRDEAKSLIAIAADGAVNNVLKNSIPYTPICSNGGKVISRKNTSHTRSGV